MMLVSRQIPAFVVLLLWARAADAFQASRLPPPKGGLVASREAPSLVGHAVLRDADQDHLLGLGDEIVLRFDRRVRVDAPDPSAIALPVVGDSLGSGASLASGPGLDQVTITLGLQPALAARGIFAPTALVARSPSGLDVSSLPGGIVGLTNGVPAVPSVPVDLVAGWVAHGQSLPAAKSARLASFDCDGTPDLALQEVGQLVQIWSGNGDGAFSPTSATTGHVDTTTFAAFDVDQDGDTDLIDGRPNDQEPSLWMNTGGGTFQEVQRLARSTPTSMPVGDLNDDGYLDLVIANATAQKNTTWFNSGILFFYASGQFFDSTEPVAAVLIDLDQDGDLDFASGNTGQSNTLWWNDGTGFFVDSGITWGSLLTTDIAAADVDLDGDPDLVDCALDQPTRIWNTMGATLSGGASFGEAGATSVCVADLDQDALPDFVLGRNDAAEVWFRRSGNTFLELDEDLTSLGATRVQCDDLDSDGDADFVLTSATGAGASWLGSGATGQHVPSLLATNQFLPPSPTEDVAHADLDCDGDIDFALANERDFDRVFINNGLAVFSLRTSFGDITGRTRSIASGDIDDDGDRDLVTVNSDPNLPSEAWRNDGTALFTRIWTTAGDEGFATLLVDLDGDGDLDLPIGSHGDSRVLFNNGLGSYFFTGQVLGDLDTNALEAGDLDCDGDLDIVEGVGAAEGNRVWLNGGSGSFVDSGQVLGMPDTFEVLLGDLDSSGSLDVVFCNSLAQVNTVWLNDGAASFVELPQSFPIGATQAGALHDFDFDGTLDFLAGNFSPSPSHLYLNDGTGVFVESGLVFSLSNLIEVGVADLDRDGDPDFIAANTNQSTRIWLHR